MFVSYAGAVAENLEPVTFPDVGHLRFPTTTTRSVIDAVLG